MTQRATDYARGSVSRGDLLRVLAATTCERLTLDEMERDWLGYEFRPEPVFEQKEASREDDVLTRRATPVAPRFKPPLKLTQLHVVTNRFRREEPVSADNPNAMQSVPELRLEQLTPESPVWVDRHQDLVPRARLVPSLKRALFSTRHGAIHIERLVGDIAQRKTPLRIPRRQYYRWDPDLIVVLDFSQRLWPYRVDMHKLCALLVAHCGESSVSLRVIDGSPRSDKPDRPEWTDWIELRDWRPRSAYPAERSWKKPAPGANVLLVSDLGLLQAPDSAERLAWLKFVEVLTHNQARPIALAPLGLSQVDESIGRKLPIMRWSPDARMRPERHHQRATNPPSGLEDLLAMAAAGRRIDPPLLRKLRELTRDGSLNSGLEGAFWSHADVDATFHAALTANAYSRYGERFREFPEGTRRRVRELQREHHSHLPRLLKHLEAYQWFRWATKADSEASPEAEAEFEEARSVIRSLAKHLAERNEPPESVDWRFVAGQFFPEDEMQEAVANDPDLLELARAVIDDDLKRNRQSDLEGVIDAASVRDLGDTPTEIQRQWLVEDPQTHRLWMQPRPPEHHQVSYGEPLELVRGFVRIEVSPGCKASAAWLRPSGDAQAIADLGRCKSVTLDTGVEVIAIEAVRRPRGIASWGRSSDGALFVEVPPLGKHPARWDQRPTKGDRYWSDHLRFVEGQLSTGTITQTRASSVPAPPLRQIDFGIDLEYGAYADIYITTEFVSAQQRLRWIEPGEFLMGSPVGEPERVDDEGPQHLVRLTKGYWLADTACTQSLWLAVMGTNPSQFTGDGDRPVEQVSWDDVQGFLRKLEQMIAGCSAGLPTEAEWEYACRAGTITPFSFGKQITPELVNYHGNYPYADGEKGLYRKQTVAVKSFRANQWGLYEMHGNVWEWCADNLREYDKQAQVDPVGPTAGGEDAIRAFRGGSWFDLAWWARSASRSGWPQGDRSAALGFRFSLRSIEPGQGLAPGGRGKQEALPPRDEAGRDASKAGRRSAGPTSSSKTGQPKTPSSQNRPPKRR